MSGFDIVDEESMAPPACLHVPDGAACTTVVVVCEVGCDGRHPHCVECRDCHMSIDWHDFPEDVRRRYVAEWSGRGQT